MGLLGRRSPGWAYTTLTGASPSGLSAWRAQAQPDCQKAVLSRVLPTHSLYRGPQNLPAPAAYDHTSPILPNWKTSRQPWAACRVTQARNLSSCSEGLFPRLHTGDMFSILVLRGKCPDHGQRVSRAQACRPPLWVTVSLPKSDSSRAS